MGVPTFNRSEHLREALPRILGQQWDPLEVVVVDDGSSDATAGVVSSVRDPRLRYVRLSQNVGIPRVLNRILEEATGDWIVILHDHDIHHPALLSSMGNVLLSDDKIGFVNPGLAWVDPDGSNYTEMRGLPSGRVNGRDLAREMLLGPSFACPITACSLVRREAYEAVGFFYDERFGFLSDVDLWLRLLLRFDASQAGDVQLVCRRREPGHEYHGVNWQLVEWSVAIQEANLVRLAGEDPVPASWRRRLRSKARRLAMASLAAAAFQADPAPLRQAMPSLASGRFGRLLEVLGRWGERHPSAASRTLLAAGALGRPAVSALRQATRLDHRTRRAAT